MFNVFPCIQGNTGHGLSSYSGPAQGRPTRHDGTVNTNSGFDVRISVENVKALQANAVIPSQTYLFQDSVAINTSSIAVDEATVKTGNIELSFLNGFPLSVNLALSIPELELTPGTAYSQTVSIQENGTAQLTIPLANATVKLRESALDFQVTAVVSGSSGPLALNSNDNIQINTSVSPLTLEQVTGTFDVSKALPAFDEPFLGDQIEGLDSLNLSNATLSLVFNSPPFDMTVVGSISGMKGGAAIRSLPFNIVAPRNVVTTVTFDNTGINGDGASPTIVDLLNLLPERLLFGGAATVSGSGVTVSRSDVVDVQMNAAVPLEFEIPTTVVSSTEAVDLSQDARETIRDNVISARLQGAIENYTPFSATVNVFLGNTPQSTSIAFIQDIALTAGTLDGSGYVTSPGISTLDIQLGQTQLNDLLNYQYFKTVITLAAGPGSRLTASNIHPRREISNKKQGSICEQFPSCRTYHCQSS